VSGLEDDFRSNESVKYSLFILIEDSSVEQQIFGFFSHSFEKMVLDPSGNHLARPLTERQADSLYFLSNIQLVQTTRSSVIPEETDSNNQQVAIRETMKDSQSLKSIPSAVLMESIKRGRVTNFIYTARAGSV
jgi:hypothetical protein